MTDKEIKKIRDEIPEFKDGKPCDLTPEQIKLHRELDCRDMINSCLCYNTDFFNSSYCEPYIKELGKERVVELFNEQKADVEKGTIISNVFEDGEGVIYNSIRWADEEDEPLIPDLIDDESEEM